MDIVEETESGIKSTIQHAISKVFILDSKQIPDIILEKPVNKSYGDYATNIAMQLSNLLSLPPREIAEKIVSEMTYDVSIIDKIEIAGPGFINIHLKSEYLSKVVPTILQAGASYGESNIGEGHKIQVEFVSANPTGDLHLGHARGAAYGDALCNILDLAGFDVQREYYINDAGNQIDNMALSIEARYMQAIGNKWEMPEEGYHGADIIDIGNEIAKKYGESWSREPSEKRLSFFREFGLKHEMNKIKNDLAHFGVFFDRWFSESSLYKDNQINNTIDELRHSNAIYEKDGAVWFRTTDYGDDKDRVLVKSDGTYTYMAPDVAYHKNKFLRGFDTVINIWGADHHGYISRMKAAIEALGHTRSSLEVQIIQMVSLFEDGERVKMSKRTGKSVTLRQLIEEVGTDSMRYFFNMRSCDSHLDFDMDLARSQSNDNPVYYVQYAHARICTLLKQAEKKGFNDFSNFDSNFLVSEKEIALLKQLGDFPQVVKESATKRTPHRVTQYVYELSRRLHSFYNAEKVLDFEKKEQTNTRLAMMQSVKITIENALNLIGVKAPERM